MISGSRPAPPRKPAARTPARVATGPIRFDYRPRRDGKPDPGEIVWAWVPFDENDGRGKDRPVLVVSRDADDVLALMLTSKDHHRDAADEARWGRYWIDIGSGPWDRRRRPARYALIGCCGCRSTTCAAKGRPSTEPPSIKSREQPNASTVDHAPAVKPDRARN